MRKLIFAFVFVLALLALAVPAFAQSEVPPEQGELAAALSALLKLVSDLTFVPLAAGFVIAVTALLKRVLPEAIPAGGIALSVQVVVWVVYIVAKHYGYAEQFGSYINALTTILTAVSGLVVSSYAATQGYKRLADKHVPLLGYQRGNKAA